MTFEGILLWTLLFIQFSSSLPQHRNVTESSSSDRPLEISSSLDSDSNDSDDRRKGFMNASCSITNQSIQYFAVDSLANKSLCIASVRLVLEKRSNTSCQENDAVRLRQSVCDAFHEASDGALVCSLCRSVALPCREAQVSWFAGPWSKCDRSCGKGKQSRDVWCFDVWNSTEGSFRVLPDELCRGEWKPVSFRHCYLGSCFGADWVVSEWSGCHDRHCDQAYETRFAMCVGKDGRIHEESVCDPLRRPITNRACHSIRCKTKTSPSWFSSSWSTCSVTCGRGKQFRKVFCVGKEEENGIFRRLPDHSCHVLDRLSEERECVKEGCLGVWVFSSFGKCSVSCGGGERMRYVWCFLDGHLVDKSLCTNGTEGPNDIEDCSMEPCPETLSCSEQPFGCCSDGVTPADGPDKANCPLDDEGSPDPDSCHSSEFGCCPDQETPAQGPFAYGCARVDNDCQEIQDPESGCCSNATSGDEDSGPKTSDSAVANVRSCNNSSFNRSARNITDNSTIENYDASAENNSSEASSSSSVAADFQSTEAAVSPSNESRGALNGSERAILTENSSYVVVADDNFTDMLFETILLSAADISQNLNSSDEIPSSNSSSASDDESVFPEDNEVGPSGSSGCSGLPRPDGTMEDGCETESPLERKQKPELCSFPMSVGDCSEMLEAWFYNDTLDRCFSFNYSGCGGNKNRFSTEHQCNSVCRSKMKSISESLAVCVLPEDRGPCNVPITKWRYNLNLGLCQSFTFGGCEGNDNKFDTRKECEGFCSVFDICHLPVDVGSNCSHPPSERYFFSPSAEKCLPFDYGGCRGNANRFNSFRDCSIVCKQAFNRLDLCELRSDPGPCKWFSTMFYYDSSLGSCERFSFGGCGGNRNRFSSVEKCLENCAVGNRIHSQSTLANQSASECALRSDPGPCKAYRPMWYYESVEKSCRRFLYGGCGGNGNRFETQEDCARHCVDDSSDSNSLILTSPESVISSTVSSTSSLSRGDSGACLLPKDQGPCFAYQLRWYFDQLEARCQQFHFSGCEGNGNNFDSAESCEVACREFIVQRIPPKESGTCSADRDPGPCFAEFLRYHYDDELGECRPFTFGGCQGNENNFVSQEDCYESCANNRSSAVAKRRRIYRPGDCYEALAVRASCAQRVRWYFDIISGDCLPFYYGGCDVSGNNFHSHEDCASFCLKVIELCGVFQCDLECEFGHRRGPDGCLQCACTDPCDNTICRDNMECHLDNSSCVENDVCQPKPTCRPAEKSGTCPVFSDNRIDIHGCRSECRRDADCSGTDKCCMTGCGKTCVPIVPGCAVSVYGCCPDGNTTATDWSFRGCPEEPPSISDDPAVVVAMVGDNVSIPCRARAAPLPQISWYKDGEPIVGRSANEVEAGDRSSSDDRLSAAADGSLVIRNVSKADAEASYTCRALNSVASATKTYSLVVQVAARILSVVPENVTAYEGENTTFECVAEGDPAPAITWHRNDEPVERTGASDANARPVRSFLTIESVRSGDEGTYECRAANGIGATQRKSVWLEVIGYLYVEVTTNASNVSVGSQANIWCDVNVTTSQPVRISWKKDGNVIPAEDNRFRQIGNELVIERLELTDSGEYGCTVERGKESVENSTYIQVTEEDDGVPEGCTDNPSLADCALLVEADQCLHPYYRIFCCRSCFLAAALRKP